jgi:hypothetical protein
MIRIHPRNRIATLLTTNIRDQVARARASATQCHDRWLRPAREIRRSAWLAVAAAFETGAPELDDLRATLTGRPTSCAGVSMPYGPS